MSTSAPGAFKATPRLGVMAACAFALLIAGLDVIHSESAALIGLLVAPPFLAAVFAPYRHVLLVGLFSAALAVGLGVYADEATSAAQMITLAVIIGGTVLAAILAELRERASERVASLSRLAAVAQQAVLRTVGPDVGDLSLAVRYVSASEDADIGGDLYEAIDTAYGVRLLVGDVRGKGLDAVRLASAVLGSYRHVVYERADPRAIVTDLDRAVARSVGTEDFVTICLLE
jgi:phosphoserine phosphatase RsbU/P